MKVVKEGHYNIQCDDRHGNPAYIDNEELSDMLWDFEDDVDFGESKYKYRITIERIEND